LTVRVHRIKPWVHSASVASVVIYH